MKLCSKGSACVQLKQSGAPGIYTDCLSWMPAGALTPAEDYVCEIRGTGIVRACVGVRSAHSMNSLYFIEVRAAKNCGPATEIFAFNVFRALQPIYRKLNGYLQAQGLKAEEPNK